VALELCTAGQRLWMKFIVDLLTIAGLIVASSWMTVHIGMY